MKNDNKYLVTTEGMKELKDELEYRSKVRREELRVLLDESRRAGDLKENEGYAMTAEEQQLNEARISELEALIEKAEIVEECSKTNICLGSKVTVKNGEEKVLELVGEDQSNPLENKISYKSPLGVALMDKKVGDKVKVETPAGTTEYTVLKIV